MIEYKSILGYLSTLVAIVAYVIYFRQIFSGKVKPHAFSWFIWALTTGIIFVAQIVKGGGAGAWVTGLTALACFVIFVLALFKGKRDFAKIDWVFLASALSAIVLWWITRDPTLSVILITITDTIGAFPTFRKSYYEPNQESATLFGLNSLKFVVALFALGSYTITTWLYPAILVLTNAIIVLLILVGRHQQKVTDFPKFGIKYRNEAPRSRAPRYPKRNSPKPGTLLRPP